MTACAYAVMTYRALDVRLESATENALMATLATHGTAIMLVEIVLLSIATVGAIALDQYRQSRAQQDSLSEEKNSQ